MLPSFAADTITVIRPVMHESRGTTVPDWANAQRHVIRRCHVQLPATGMDLDGRMQTQLTGTVYAPANSDIRAGDRIEWTDCRDVTHHLAVIGEPMPWQSPTGRVSHVQARVAEWEG